MVIPPAEGDIIELSSGREWVVSYVRHELYGPYIVDCVPAPEASKLRDIAAVLLGRARRSSTQSRKTTPARRRWRT
jgi:hypothetical protein